MIGQALSREEKNRRALWLLAFAMTGFVFDWSVIFGIDRISSNMLYPDDFEHFATIGILRFALVVGFFLYLSLWSSLDSNIHALNFARIAVFLLATTVAPHYADIAVLVSTATSADDFIYILLSIILSIPLIIVLHLSRSVFREMRNGMEIDELSRVYGLFLFLRLPPKRYLHIAISDIWILLLILGIAWMPR